MVRLAEGNRQTSVLPVLFQLDVVQGSNRWLGCSQVRVELGTAWVGESEFQLLSAQTEAPVHHPVTYLCLKEADLLHSLRGDCSRRWAPPRLAETEVEKMAANSPPVVLGTERERKGEGLSVASN